MPPLQIIAGALPELEDAFASAVADARRADPLAPVTVLVENVLLRPYLARTLARRGVPLLDTHIVRPHELAARLGPAAAARQRLSPNAARLLVRQVAADAGGYFAAIAGREGFAEALSRLFRELDLGGFTPDAFDLAASAAAAATMVDAAKLSGLAHLFRRYADRREGFAAAADPYAAADARAFAGPLFVYGVWAPEEVVATLVERVSAVAPVSWYLATAGGAADDAHAGLRARLAAAGASVRVLPPRDDGAAPLRVGRKLFTPPTTAIDAGGAVTLLSAPDTVREVWEAARACLRWADEGMRLHEMCVAYRHRDPYRALVGEIFAVAGIDTYLHDGRPLAAHPLGRRLLALVDLAADGTFARAAVMEFLTETRLSSGLRGRYRSVQPSEWESFTREAGVVQDAAQWDARLTRLAGEKREAAQREGSEWQAEVAGRVDDLRAFAADLYRALDAHRREATWEEHLAWLRGVAASYAVGTEALVDALADLTALGLVLPRAPFDTFARAVHDDLESRDVSRVLGEPLRAFGKRGVAVVDAASLRHLRFRAVSMLGVAERAWPPPPRPDPLLLEHERRAVNAAGGGRLPLRTEPDDEALTFWLGAQAATERLTVSFARAEAGGSGRHLPSYFFRAVAEVLEGRRLAHDEVESAACVRRIAAGRLASDSAADALSAAEYDRALVQDGAPGALAAIERLAPSFGRAVAARRSRLGRTLTVYDGVLGDAGLLASSRGRIGSGAPVSPSRLEEYATCPYRYFLHNVLGLEPLEEPEAVERIDARERGSLVHAILERFLRTLGRDDPPAAGRRDAHLALLLRVAREEEEDRERRGVTGRPLLWQIDRRQIEEDLVRWYDAEVRAADDGLLPGAFEVAFGPVAAAGRGDTSIASIEPLTVRARGRDLLLQGRIDRIDWDAARRRFRVIDYKTGASRIAHAERLNRGTTLQLHVYLRAAAQLLGIDLAAGQAQYFYVSSRGGFKRPTLAGEQTAALADAFERVLDTIAAGTETGMFAPNPGKDKFTCRRCDFTAVCDARIDSIMARKADAPAAAPYRALEQIQ